MFFMEDKEVRAESPSESEMRKRGVSSQGEADGISTAPVWRVAAASGQQSIGYVAQKTANAIAQADNAAFMDVGSETI